MMGLSICNVELSVILAMHSVIIEYEFWYKTL